MRDNAPIKLLADRATGPSNGPVWPPRAWTLSLDIQSTDQTSELLQALDEVEIIQRLDWRGEKVFQLRFYLDAIPRLRGVCDVVAIIDGDEFLRPLNGRADISSAITEIFSRPEVSAAGICRVVYGSAGPIEPGEGL